MTFFGTKDECNKMHIKYSTLLPLPPHNFLIFEKGFWRDLFLQEEKKIMHGRGRKSVKNMANGNQRFGRKKNSMFVPPQICQKRSTLAKLPVVSARRGWSLKRLLYVGAGNGYENTRADYFDSRTYSRTHFFPTGKLPRNSPINVKTRKTQTCGTRQSFIVSWDFIRPCPLSVSFF